MTDFITWLAEEIKQIVLSMLNLLADGFLYLIQRIPAPDFLQDMPSYTIPPEMSYFLQPMEITYGMTVVTSAYILRFTIRRLPFIG